MRQERYLLFLPEDAGAAARLTQPLAAHARALDFHLLQRPWLLAITTTQPLLMAAGTHEGIVIGELIRREAREPVARFSASEASQIAATNGTKLAEDYWGSTVSVFSNGDRVSIRRSPFGNLACYFVRVLGGVLMASDPALLANPGGLRLAPDWDAVACQLIAPTIRRRETCLVGVLELAGGEKLDIGGDLRIAPYWSPWSYVAAPESADRVALAERLRQVICDAVAAQTALHDNAILLLSGGLDSSIVAAALARAGRTCTALNMVTRALGGDERAHARRVADHCGFPLVEINRDVSDVDVTRSLSAQQPYPVEKSFAQATLAAATRLASGTGATVILDGGGGDNIFCSLQSAAPLVDLLRREGPGRQFVAVMRDIATIAQASHGAILRQVARRLFRAPDYRWRGDLTLLDEAATGHASIALVHPWLEAPRGALPGKAGHIGLLLAALSLVQSPPATSWPPSRSILLAQPVIETCLGIPTWSWYEHGRNRALARRAFAPLLPEAAAWRQSKGSMDSFIVEIFDANRRRISEMLADGQLVRHGLIDRAAVLAVIDAAGPVRGRDYGRVMQFVDVEAWLSAWS